MSAAGGPPRSGVNVVGFFRAEFGQGEAARRLVAALEKTGIPFSTVTYDRVPHRQSHPFDERTGEAPYQSNILCLNAEHLLQFVQGEERELLRGRYSVGLWFWETDRLPRQVRPALDFVDEVWVASDFVREAIQAETEKPVLTMPLPVVVPAPPGLTRADLGLPEDVTVFLFVFDFFSTIERKNPIGLIDAYRQAFPEPADTLLYLKSINGDRSRDELARVRAAAEGRRDIVVSDAYVDHDRLTALTAHCDCYVSLHRSEGFGLTIAEAMAYGKPAIATGYSGNLAFMDAESSFLVPYSLTSLDREIGPYPAGTVWAEPDLDEAARFMQLVAEDPEQARERGRRGRKAVESKQSLDRAASFLAERVPELERRGAERSKRETPASRALGFLRDGPTVRWDAPSRSGRVGLLWRRVLLRLLRPYLIRQRELETLVVSGLEELERSRDRLEDAVRVVQAHYGERMDDLDARLARLLSELYARPFEAAADPAEARDSTYDAFEEIFRGSEVRVRELLRPYVPLLLDHAPVLDVGCGRGELLELLREAGTEARGIDLDEGMVERSRRKGLDVELTDAVAYLERQDPGSLGAVFASHVIEHLPYEELEQVFELSRRVLRPGGLFVAETINVHSLSAFKTFWTDPSHRAPIFPEVAHALALIHGFADAEIVYPRGSGNRDVDADEATEYALVARTAEV